MHKIAAQSYTIMKVRYFLIIVTKQFFIFHQIQRKWQYPYRSQPGEIYKFKKILQAKNYFFTPKIAFRKEVLIQVQRIMYFTKIQMVVNFSKIFHNAQQSQMKSIVKCQVQAKEQEQKSSQNNDAEQKITKKDKIKYKTGNWNFQEKIKYIVFVEKTKSNPLFSYQKWSWFKHMSSFIGSRCPYQSRSHHHKLFVAQNNLEEQIQCIKDSFSSSSIKKAERAYHQWQEKTFCTRQMISKSSNDHKQQSQISKAGAISCKIQQKEENNQLLQSNCQKVEHKEYSDMQIRQKIQRKKSPISISSIYNSQVTCFYQTYMNFRWNRW